jgi:hypothetical protein
VSARHRGNSEYSHGVSRAWTRVGSTRDGTVSGNTPVLACLRPRTPRGTRSTHTGDFGGLAQGPAGCSQGVRLASHTRFVSTCIPDGYCEHSRTVLRMLREVLRVLGHSGHSQRPHSEASRAFSTASAASAATSCAFAAVRSALCAARAAVAAAHLYSAATEYS